MKGDEKMKKNDITHLLNKFYITEKQIGIEYYGDYRLGLTTEEIKNYLLARAYIFNFKEKNIDKLYKKFDEIAGVNTVAVHPNGKDSLMYRHDVLRFSDVLFKKTKGTYFD